jgi:hypothetical protein
MTGRVGIRQIIVLSTVVCLLLISSRAFAQAPPAGSESEQRLKALEDKMDRVLKLLEPRGTQLSPQNVSDKHLELIKQARDEIYLKWESAQKEYQDFRVRNPLVYYKVDHDAKVALQKEWAVLHDLHLRQSELAARAGLVKKVGDVEKEARAFLVLLQRRGVDVELLRRTAGTRRDEDVPAVELVRLYGASLRQEAEELGQLVQAAEERIEKENKVLRDLNTFEVTEESLRNSRDQAQKLLDVLTAQLSKMDVMRQQQAPK